MKVILIGIFSFIQILNKIIESNCLVIGAYLFDSVLYHYLPFLFCLLCEAQLHHIGESVDSLPLFNTVYRSLFLFNTRMTPAAALSIEKNKKKIGCSCTLFVFWWRCILANSLGLQHNAATF